MGPFFKRLGRELEDHGAKVSKINLNAGDSLFYPGPNATPYRGTLEHWPDFLAEYIRTNKVDFVVLFGDRRAYHEPVHEITTRLGSRLYVFEEGYLRPNYITMELGGVNGRSNVPQRHQAFDAMPSKALPEPRIQFTGYYHAAFYGMLYHAALTLAPWGYRHYRHHRRSNGVYQAFAWIRAGFRRQWFRFKERNVVARLHARHAGKYFVVPLQVRDDAQIRCYSKYHSVEDFIEEVAASFAEHAAPEDRIVFKHHPMDRGYVDYSRFMETVREKTGLGDRLYYIHDVPMPKLLDHAKGAVMINSTTGISALHHKVPVKLLGEAIYRIRGLTCERPLPNFWREPGQVDYRLFMRFRNWLLSRTQAHGTFYRRVPGLDTPTGINWDPVSLPEGTPEPQPQPETTPASQPAPEPISAPAKTAQAWRTSEPERPLQAGNS